MACSTSEPKLAAYLGFSDKGEFRKFRFTDLAIEPFRADNADPANQMAASTRSASKNDGTGDVTLVKSVPTIKPILYGPISSAQGRKDL